MNWQVTTPGSIVFEKEEPFCFLFPIRKQAVLDCVPEIYDIAADPGVGAAARRIRNLPQRFYEALLRQ